MPTIRFTMVPPTEQQFRDTFNPSLPFVVGAIANAPTFDVELDDAATADDVEQCRIGQLPNGWSGEVLS